MPITDFTYKSYEKLIDMIKQNQFLVCSYHNYLSSDKVCILRHDIDMDIKKALKIAIIEHYKGVSSNFFVLLRTDLYNIFSKESQSILNQISEMGHQIGLHFDESMYDIQENYETIESSIRKEINILEQILNRKVNMVSMHRPSAFTLNGNFEFEGLINSYSNIYFKDLKYLSDSRMCWKENVEEIINRKMYSKLHILTHPIWYDESVITIKAKLINYINNKRLENCEILKKNTKNIDEFFKETMIK